MELLFPSFPVFFAFLLFLFMVLKSKNRLKTDCSASKTPPGPWKLPIIGNIHQMVGSLPHHALRDLAKKYGPLMHLQLGEVSTIVISSAKMAKEVMKTHDIIFASRPHILASTIMCYDSTDIAFAPYGDYWRQLRKICTLELLSMKRVKSFRSIREEEVSILIQSITSSSNAGLQVNLTEMLFSLAYRITARAAFGKKCEEKKLFISIVKEAIKTAGGFNAADLFPSIKLLHVISGMRPKLEKLHKMMDEILENVINKHKAEVESIKASKGDAEEESLVDVLIRLQEDDDLELPLTSNNIKAVILDMFSAGSETSSNTTEWAMTEMLKNPRVMEKAQAEVRHVFDTKGGKIDETDFHELKYLKLVMKETLRLHPSIPLLLPRECGERCEINGYEIAIKSKVIVNAWAIGRDPHCWTEPESFYPERFLDSSIDYKGTNFEYIPFGAGRRICPGMMFGLANVEAQLVHLLYHFDWKLPNGMKLENLDMTEVFGASVGRKEALCLIPIAYHHKSFIAG